MTILKKLKATAVAGLMGVLLAVQPALAQSDLDSFKPGEPEAGVEIPSADVKFGMKPYADNTFYIIAIQKGWFKDVGINILPEPNGIALNETNTIPLLLNGQVDISSNWCVGMMPTYTDTNELKCIAFIDNIVSASILANPKLGLKSFRDYVGEGKSFDEAIKLALAPINGKTLVGPPDATARPFENTAADLAGVEWSLQALEDSKSVVLAMSGRADFVHPNGAPIVYSLLKAGWTPLITLDDLLTHGPRGADSPIVALVNSTGIAANGNFVNENPNTVLRFLSVVWRTIDALEKDPGLFHLQAPYLNSVAGTSLTGAEITDMVAKLHPYIGFDGSEPWYADANSPTNITPVYDAIIADLEKSGVIPAGKITTDTFAWNRPIWELAKSYRDKASDLIEKVKAGSPTPEQAELLASAEQHFAWFNYLDAYRFALAASE